MSLFLKRLQARVVRWVSSVASAAAVLAPYLYFVRFSLLLWLSMPLLMYLDYANITTTATRGILTLQQWTQAFWDAFFVVIAGWIALLSARVVLAYGEERFGTPPPEWLKIGQDMSWLVFLGSQVPGAMLLAYVAHCTASDGQQSLLLTILSLFGGSLTALLVWYLLAAYYYWTYEPRIDLMREGRLARDPALLENVPDTGLEAKAFLAPVGRCPWFAKLQTYPPPAIARAFDFLFAFMVRVFGAGYGKDPEDPNSPINAGHAMAVVILAFIAVLYFVFFQYTAPVWIEGAHAAIAIVVSAVLVLWFSLAANHWVRWLRAKSQKGIRTPVTAGEVFGSIGLAAFTLLPLWGLVIIAWLGTRNETFPVLASIYILLVLICWGLAGLAFILDRFRVPVFTAALLVISILHALAAIPWLRDTPLAESQHIVRTDNRDFAVTLADPISILDRFHKSHPSNTPIIVVTATGGGIHAAAWTAQLLGDLEKTFSKEKTVVPFHDSILLVSTVSGGSVGAAEWLQAYPHFGADGRTIVGPTFEQYSSKVPNKNNNLLETPAETITECSSLEAVAWGLVYPDIFHIVFPFRLSSGLETFDRSWALQTAVERNEFSRCGNIPEDPVSKTSFRPTLGNYARMLSAETEAEAGTSIPWVPAFSLNTTVAETGDRFLLADYKLSPMASPHSELSPASSFLDVYSSSSCRQPLLPIPDLPLTAAARLSASFPYVSSMARVPRCVQEKAYHFGDGGYFDNDGTGSVIEFLQTAYLSKAPATDASLAKADSNTPESKSAGQPKPTEEANHSHPQHADNILLIEIRDGDDPRSDYPPDGIDPQSRNAKFWGPPSQLGGPIQTFYHAGHESVTRRNRRELCILESALVPSQVHIEHYVIAYHQDRPNFTQPLNWHLTAADKSEIQRNLGGSVTYTVWNGGQPNQQLPPTPTPNLENRIAQRYQELQQGNSTTPASGTATPGDCVIEDNQ